jgi:hypothetical protein
MAGACTVIFRLESQVIKRLCDWLVATPLSITFQTWTWFVPSVQAVHIICISIVVIGVMRVSLHLIRVERDGNSLLATLNHAMPTIWVAMGILLTTGVLLTITEPARELLNWVFRTKMVLVVLILSILSYAHRTTSRNPGFWSQSPVSRSVARLCGLTCLGLGAAIITAGRWIAYV